MSVRPNGVSQATVRDRNFLEQFTGAVTDEHRLVAADVIAIQERALNFLVDGNEITNFFPHIVHDDLPGPGTNLHERVLKHHHPICEVKSGLNRHPWA